MLDNIYKEVESKEKFIDKNEQRNIMRKFANQLPESLNNILIVPPDYTRVHSGVGILTSQLYELLKDKVDITIMPALGTHKPMSKQEIKNMFGNNIPSDIFKVHDYINDTVSIGEIPKNYVNKISNGKVNRTIDVKINKELLKDKYDLVISMGQVLPHGVVGMSNYNKNILVGCGGREVIDVSHYIGAVHGMEKLIGEDHSPVRDVLDYAENNFLKDLNIIYVLSVNSIEMNPKTQLTNMLGIFIGSNRESFEKAVKASQKFNIIRLKNPVNKMIVYMDGAEFNSTWLACKAIYRTRPVIADGGELIVLSPGLEGFGENERIDNLIRKYGYMGKEKIQQYVKENKDLKKNLAAAAHLIHGSTEGRFSVTFATDKLSKKELNKVNHRHINYEKAKQKYQPDDLEYGYNKLTDGQKIFYIENPATGLWKLK